MTFPTTPLDVKVELSLNGTWTDVTAKTYTRSLATIIRGRQDEDSRAQPGKAMLVLNNRDGRFSPRNPTGPYYGVIGRNTPVRVSARIGSVRLVSPTNVDWAQCPDSAGISITGDIDLRIDARMPDWTRGDQFVTKYNSAGTASYILGSNSDGTLVLFWSVDGTNFLSASSTVPLPQTTGRQSVRATLDVDNGAAGRTITFYTGATVDGPWVQLGSAVVQAGTTSIFDSTATLRTARSTAVEVYAMKVLQGIGGTERANPNFTAQADGTTSFADAAGNTWTLGGAAVITNRRYRFYGEISSWPQSWDLSGNDVWVSAEAAGILRRLGAGASPLLGPIQRAVLSDTATPYGYWPMEDEVNSASIASGLTGGPAMAITGAPELAASDDFLASGPVPVVSGAAFTGAVLPHADTGTVHAQILLSTPAALGFDNGVIMRVFTTGTASRWDLVYSGGLNLLAYDNSGANILSTGAGFTVQGQVLAVVIEMVQNAGNIDWKILTLDNGTGAGLQFTGTLNTQTIGHAILVQVNPTGVMTTQAVGHLVVTAAIPSSNAQSALRGWTGETAGRRVERLCSESGVAFTAYGDLDQSVALGVQRPSALLDLLVEAETADMGQLFESREQLGLAYRTRDSRQYQNVSLALAYGNLSELVPVEDDQATQNDVTASRTGGSSARVTVDSGPLSTQAPPNGVGRYAVTAELNLATDSQLGDHAQWRATEGTVDEARYPNVVVNLERPPIASSSTKTDGALSVDHGDLITVSGPPAWLPPDTIKQHTIGQVEVLGVFDYSIDFVCQSTIPAGATGLYDDGTSRYAPTGATLNAGITSTATGVGALSLVTPAGSPLWTSAAGDFPMDIRVGGEVITLSAIAATASPQSATVSARSVNGVVKAQSAGAAVDIADPVFYSL